MHLQPLERFARSERMLVESILCDDSIDDFLRQRFEFFRSGPHDSHVRHGDGLFSGGRPSRGGPGQSLSFRSAHALAIADSLPFLQNRGRHEPWVSLGFFLSQEHVKEKVDSQSVTATIQLGNWCLSRGLSKNVSERLLFSRSFHSPPSLKAASPADFS